VNGFSIGGGGGKGAHNTTFNDKPEGKGTESLKRNAGCLHGTFSWGPIRKGKTQCLMVMRNEYQSKHRAPLTGGTLWKVGGLTENQGTLATNGTKNQTKSLKMMTTRTRVMGGGGGEGRDNGMC